MTATLDGRTIAQRVSARFADAVEAAEPGWLRVRAERLVDVVRFLRDEPELTLEQLDMMTAVDYMDYFELVYLLLSVRRNHQCLLKCWTGDRADPAVPSLVPVLYGALLQERETYDLFGIRFADHPDLRRVLLWEGFAGWPLRKDFLQIGQGAFHPGLPHFPKEGGERGLLTGPNWTGEDAAQELNQ